MVLTSPIPPTTRALALLSLLVLRATLSGCDPETTTVGNIVIRRRLPSSRTSGGGGGRLSLMNSRFNRRPRRKDLDQEQLLQILGSGHWDPDWMSAEEPDSLSDRDPDRDARYVYRQDGLQREQMLQQLRGANLSRELYQLSGSRTLEEPLFARTVEKWLMKRASCPVRYAWEDIGTLFWPRYIRRGECASVPGTCSWPPGMHCVPSGTTNLQVLRWQCKVAKNKGGRRRQQQHFKNPKNHNNKDKDWPKKINGGEQQPGLKCSWVRVPYPITSDCLCTC